MPNIERLACSLFTSGHRNVLHSAKQVRWPNAFASDGGWDLVATQEIGVLHHLPPDVRMTWLATRSRSIWLDAFQHFLAMKSEESISEIEF